MKEGRNKHWQTSLDMVDQLDLNKGQTYTRPVTKRLLYFKKETFLNLLQILELK